MRSAATRAPPMPRTARKAPCAAMEAIAEMKKVPGAIVGAGTVVNEGQARQVIDAGVEFIVSPGLTERLAKPILDAGVAYLPGTATAGDIMRGLDLGLTHFKFFPAETSGGLKALKALAAPFYQCRFCPTGGIDPEKAKRYLALPNVVCVGGSWLVPRDAVRQGDWARITELARGTAALRQGVGR